MHSPFIVPDEYSAPYKEQGVPDQRSNFYGMIANFDENMGRLFKRLADLGLDENTIVIFTADHGTAAGFDPETGDGYNAGMRGKKGAVYEGGHRINFFIRWQNTLPAGRQIDQLTAHIDILPTLTDLCDLRHQLQFDGISLAPYIRAEKTPLPDRTLFVHLQPDQPVKWNHCVVLRDHWRLINGQALYDLATDPGQQIDIANQQQEIVGELRAAYDEWWESLQPAFADYVYIPVGTSHENPTILTARDWHPTEGRIPWMQDWISDLTFDANGFWAIEVTKAGQYRISLRRYPVEANLPLGVDTAWLKIVDSEEACAANPNSEVVDFTVDLESCNTTLHTRFKDSETGNEYGAYYAYIQYLGRNEDEFETI